MSDQSLPLPNKPEGIPPGGELPPAELPEGFVPVRQGTAGGTNVAEPAGIAASAHFGVVGQIYHQTPPHPPDGEELRFARMLSTDEQPWGPRRTKVGPDWQPIEPKNYIESNPSLVTIANNAGMNISHIPSREEMEDIATKVIEVAVFPVSNELKGRTMRDPPLVKEPTPFMIILPGEKWPIPLAVPLQFYRIRCRLGIAPISVTIYPG